MRKKNIILLILAAVFTLHLFANTPVSLKKQSGHQTGSRTEEVVTASINQQVLTVSFSDVTASDILVYEESDPDTLLFSQTFTPAYSVEANLTTLPTGDYVVEIYAFGEWWTGSFYIE